MAKRANGEGTIYRQARSGRWVGAYRERPGGPRQYVYGRTQSEVVAELARVRRGELKVPGLTATPAARPDVMTVGEWLDHWVEKILPTTKLTKASRDSYYWGALRVKRYLGHIALPDLDADDVDRMMAAMAGEGLAPDTMRISRTTLRRALGVALKRKKVTTNVVSMTEPPARSLPRVNDALSVAEVESVLAMAGQRDEKPEPTPGVCPVCGEPVERRGGRGPLPKYCSTPCKNAVAAPAGWRLEALAVLVLMCGLRQGEALDLRWEHLELDVDEPVAHVHGTKSDASGRRVPREVPLPGRVVEALRRHRRAQLKERAASKYWNDPGLVFATTIGTRYDKRAIVRWWHALTERAGVGRRRFHASRHTAATVMLNAGVPLELISAILGHSSLAITSDIYAKPGKGLKRQAATAMDKIFGTGA